MMSVLPAEVSRQTAEAILAGHAPGAFVLRRKTPETFVISFVTDSGPKHTLVMVTRGKFRTKTSPDFDSLQQLLDAMGGAMALSLTGYELLRPTHQAAAPTDVNALTEQLQDREADLLQLQHSYASILKGLVADVRLQSAVA